jgi:hypothetical protein
VNTKHKIGLNKPNKRGLGLTSAVGAEPMNEAAERILRDQFWLTPVTGGRALVHRFPASRAKAALCAARSREND